MTLMGKFFFIENSSTLDPQHIRRLRSSREIQIRLGNCMTRLLQFAVSDYGLIGTAATPKVTVTSHGN